MSINWRNTDQAISTYQQETNAGAQEAELQGRGGQQCIIMRQDRARQPGAEGRDTVRDGGNTFLRPFWHTPLQPLAIFKAMVPCTQVTAAPVMAYRVKVRRRSQLDQRV
jgi:hypothetical protein